MYEAIKAQAQLDQLRKEVDQHQPLDYRKLYRGYFHD